MTATKRRKHLIPRNNVESCSTASKDNTLKSKAYGLRLNS